MLVFDQYCFWRYTFRFIYFTRNSLSQVKLNRIEHVPYDHNARPSQTDRWTDIMTIARRFVLMDASRAKNKGIRRSRYVTFKIQTLYYVQQTEFDLT